MSDDHQATKTAIRELAAEMRRLRQAILLSFAIFSFIGGLLLLCYPSYELPLWALFVASAAFLFWATCSRLAKFANELREEARRQHSQMGRGVPDER